jgi:hypothetical protein
MRVRWSWCPTVNLTDYPLAGFLLTGTSALPAPIMRRESVFVIADERHGESRGQFETFDQAIREVQQLAEIRWDEAPNRAPCISWRTCGRSYSVREYDESTVPRELLRDVAVCEVSASGVSWRLLPPESSRN